MRRLSFYMVSLLTVLGRAAPAMIVSQDAIVEELASAALVLRIEVETKNFYSDPVYHARWIVTARVKHVYETRDGGPVPSVGDVIALEGVGGEIDERGVLLNGYPRPFVGTTYKAYLNRAGTRFEIAGFEAGLTPENRLRVFTRNRTDGSDGEGTGPFLVWLNEYFPIPYFISAPTFEYHSNFVTAIVESFRTWAEVDHARVDFVGLGCSATKANQNDGINNVIYERENWIFGSSVIAITRNFYISGNNPNAGMILDSDILLNGVDHEFTTTGEMGKFDVQNIMTHEIGHLLGLGHDEDPASDTEATMFESAALGETKKRTLATNDILGIRDAYPGTSVKLGAPALGCEVGTTPACVAVRRGCGTTPAQSLPWLGVLLGILLAGRWYAGRKTVPRRG